MHGLYPVACIGMTKISKHVHTLLSNFLRLTYIFIVPFGPRFVLRTFCSPIAALVFTCNAAAALAISAFGFNACMADIFITKCQ